MVVRAPVKDSGRQSRILVEPDAGADRQRLQARIRQRRKRDREKAGLRFYRVGVAPAVLEALVLRSIDGGLSEPEAERAVLDRRKVAVDLSEVAEQWAASYIIKRDSA